MKHFSKSTCNKIPEYLSTVHTYEKSAAILPVIICHIYFSSPRKLLHEITHILKSMSTIAYSVTSADILPVTLQ